MFFRFFRSKLFLIAGITALSFIIFNLIKVSVKQKAIQSEINQLSAKRDQIELENRILEKQLNKAGSDFEPELLAKRTLNYKRPGETIFIFYPVSDVKPIQQASENDNILKHDAVLKKDQLEQRESSINNALLWWHYFFE